MASADSKMIESSWGRTPWGGTAPDADPAIRSSDARVRPKGRSLVRGGGEVDGVVDRGSRCGVGDDDVPGVGARRAIGPGARQRGRGGVAQRRAVQLPGDA